MGAPPRAAHTSEVAAALADDLLERFTRYVRVGTQAVRHRERSPSSPGQLELGRMLVAELQELGLTDAALDDQGYVYATLPATVGADAPVIGLIAHLDTSPDAPGDGVEPIVHRAYDGTAIELPRDGTVLDPARMPELTQQTGKDIVTSSGDTLLGADDKAGVAAIMAAVAFLSHHPDRPRPTLRIGFTPDEEIGEGATLFDIERFGAVCAYTLDGSDVGELQDETFSAMGAVVTIEGVEVHPGFAYGRMVNAALLAARFVAALPPELTPARTRGRDGFIHVHSLSASATRAQIELIVRDFDDTLLAERVELVRRTARELRADEPRARVNVQVQEQYPNMKRFLDRFPPAGEAALAAIRAEGLQPRRAAIRGGTDGSRLSEMGLLTPNLFTGGHEFHSVREWASVQDMASAAATIVRLAEVWTGPELRRVRPPSARV